MTEQTELDQAITDQAIPDQAPPGTLTVPAVLSLARVALFAADDDVDEATRMMVDAVMDFIHSEAQL